MGVHRVKDINAPKFKKFNGKRFVHNGTFNSKEYAQMKGWKMRQYTTYTGYRVVKVKNGMYRVYLRLK